MLPLDHDLWKQLDGGYRARFDASEVLADLHAGKPREEIWELLWDELHHQGDVGDASYAAVPHLLHWLEHADTLEWNPIALIAVIENRRTANPAPREEIAPGYFDAIQRSPEVLAKHPTHPWSDEVTAAAIWLISEAKGNPNYGQFLDYFDLAEAQDWVRENNVFEWIDQ